MKLSLFILSLAWALNAHAFSCYQKSFEYARQGEAYFEMKAAAANINDLRKELQLLQREFSDRWRGRIQEIECVGQEASVEQQSDYADVDVDIKNQFERGLKASFYKRYRRANKVSQQILQLLNGTLLHQLQLEPGRLDASEMYRRRTQSGHSVLIEVETEINYSINKLLIQQIYFTNGVSLITKTIELTRVHKRQP